MPKTELKPFEQALLDAGLEEFSDIPSEEEIELELSAAFEAKGEEILEKARRGRLRTLSTTVRRAILIAAIIALLATTALAVPYIRRVLIEFFPHSTGSYYEFSFDQEMVANAPDYIEKVYKPTYIPRGYTVDTNYVGMGYVCQMWVSKSDEWITFSQMPIPNDGEGPSPDADDVTTQYLYWNSYEIFHVQNEEYSMYYWTDHEYLYELLVPNSVSERNQRRIFDSIELDEDAVIPEH